MTTDFEQQLRTLLTDSADASRVDVDRPAVLAAGGRALYTRRLVLGGVTALAALGIAGGLLAGLPGVGTIGVPAPAATATASRPAPATVTFTLDRSGNPSRPWSDEDPASITIGATQEPDGSFRVDYSTTDVAGQQGVTTSAGIAAGRATWGLGNAIDGYLVGVVPGVATTILTVPDAGSATGDQRVIPGTGLTAFYWRGDDTHLADVQGLVWLDGDGSVHNSSGETVPSATLGTGDRSFTVFADPTLQVAGATHLGTTGSGPWAAEGGKPTVAGGWDSATRVGWAAGLLPTGATAVKATFHKGVGDHQVEVSGAVGPQGRIFFVASGTFRDSGVLDTVSWTDGAGKRITVDASK